MICARNLTWSLFLYFVRDGFRYKSFINSRFMYYQNTNICIITGGGLDGRHVHGHLATQPLAPTHHTKKQLETKTFTIHTGGVTSQFPSQKFSFYRPWNSTLPSCDCQLLVLYVCISWQMLSTIISSWNSRAPQLENTHRNETRGFPIII
jgi:hypothetical protein